MNTYTITKNDWFYIAVITALITFTFLGVRTLSIPDEGRYVSIAVEMLRTGDYVVPRLNGVQYLYKPPMFYWLNAFALSFSDNIEVASRMVSAILSWLTILLTFFVSCKFYGRVAGYCSAIFLSLSFSWYLGGRIVNLDLAVAVFMAWSMFAYILGITETDTVKRTIYLYGIYIFSAFAVLTKGFIGVVLPGAVFFLHIVLTNNWKLILRLHIPTGIMVFLAIVLPWHILMNTANSEWFDFYIIREHILRFFTTTHSRYEPAYYFIPILFLSIMPFGMFAVTPFLRLRDIWHTRKKYMGLELYMWVWVVCIFMFFSMSKSKLPLYILPIVPAIAIMAGKLASQYLDGVAYTMPLKIWAGIYGILAISFGGIFIVLQMFPFFVPETEISGLSDKLIEMGWIVKFFAFGFIAHGIVVLFGYFVTRRLYVLVLMVGVYIPTVISANYFFAHLNYKSTKPMISMLKKYKAKGYEIAFERFIEDTPAYLNGYVSLVNYGGESAHFLHYEDISDRYHTVKKFEQLWASGKPMLGVSYTSKLYRIASGLKKYRVIYTDALYTIITNK